MKELKELCLWKVPVSNISAISSLNKLTDIYLINTKVTDVSPIAKLKNNKWISIYISNSNLRDISPLANYDLLHGLKYLTLLNNEIEDLSAFGKLKKTPRIRYIELGNNRILDFKPFEKIYKKSYNVILDKDVGDGDDGYYSGVDYYHEEWDHISKFFFLESAFNVFRGKETIHMLFDTINVYFYENNDNDDYIEYVNAQNFIENMGGEFSYNRRRGEITMKLNERIIIMNKDSNNIKVDNKSKPMVSVYYGNKLKSPLKIMQGDIPYIPVKEIAKEFGFRSELDKRSQTDVRIFDN